MHGAAPVFGGLAVLLLALSMFVFSGQWRALAALMVLMLFAGFLFWTKASAPARRAQAADAAIVAPEAVPEMKVIEVKP